jgi:hypothetical protein
VCEHYVLMRWPGPGLIGQVGDVKLRHCYPTKIMSLPETVLEEALQAGFQYMRWAQL